MEDDLDDSCAQCGTKQNSVSNLNEQVFRVNTAGKCGHQFCSQCVEREFSKKRQFACPKCKTTVTLDKLSLKSLDETEVERDYSIRKKVKAIYNKGPSDFASLLDYKDYEEEVEDIIYKLVNQIDVEETNKRIEAYKADNVGAITLNQFKKSEELKQDKSSIETDLEEKRLKHERQRLEFDSAQAAKKQQKRQMNQLMLGELDNSRSALSGSMAPTSTAAAAAAGAAPQAVPTLNVAQQFLAQRAEPAVVVRDASKKRKIKTSQDLKAMHRVGGYDYRDYERRNWFEIKTQLRRE